MSAGLTSIIAAWLCTSFLGWPSIFYILGVLGLCWAVVWLIFSANRPAECRWVSEDEQLFLAKNLGKQKRPLPLQNAPWRQLLLGKTTLSIYGVQFAFNITISLLQSFLPTFLKEHLMLPIHMNGIYNMIPFMSQMIAKLFVVSLTNWLKAREITGADASVKIFQGLGSLGCGVTIFLLAVVPSCEHPTWAIPILICHGISFSCSIPGFFTALVSIAPPYTGTMTSLGRTCATLGNISGAMMMSLIDKMNWPNKWLIIFSFGAVCHLLTGLNFVFHGKVTACTLTITTMIGPLLANLSYWSFFTSRVVLGLGDGFIIPCINTVITRWFPRKERSTAAAIYTLGNQLTSGLTAIIAAWLCTSIFEWPSIFYLSGFTGIAWAVVWMIFSTDRPADCRWVSEDEKLYLADSMGRPKKPFPLRDTPWKKLLLSKTTIAVYGIHSSERLCLSNGVYNMIPYMVQMFGKLAIVWLANVLKSYNVTTADSSVKIFQGMSSIGCGVTIFLLAVLPDCEHPEWSIPILIVHGLAFSCIIPGFFTSLLLIAPPYTGTMTSGWKNKWLIIFSLDAFCQLTSGVFFIFYGKATIQEWAIPATTTIPTLNTPATSEAAIDLN
ncbi:unnamed protein product, partial [Mesorhabditis spiculigera]